MREQIERILERYERGHVSRRAFVQAIGALVMMPVAVSAEPPKSLFTPVNLNHVTMAVSDLKRTRDFYESILGMKVYKQNGNGLFLGIGEHFVGADFAPKVNENVGIDHFCIGVEGFDEKNAKQVLAARSIETFTEGGRGVYFRDPNGIKVQISSPDYRG